MVGLARLVGLVLRRPGDRCELPAARACLDALHRPCSWADGGSRNRAIGDPALGRSSLVSRRRMRAAPTTRCGRCCSGTYRRREPDALGSLRLPPSDDVLWFVAGHGCHRDRLARRSLGSALLPARHMRCPGWRGSAIQRHSRARSRHSVLRAACHERRLLRPGSALGPNRWSRCIGSMRVVASALRGWLEPAGAMGGPAIQRLGIWGHLADSSLSCYRSGRGLGCPNRCGPSPTHGSGGRRRAPRSGPG